MEGNVTTGEFARTINALRDEMREGRAEILDAVKELSRFNTAHAAVVGALGNRVTALETTGVNAKDTWSRTIGLLALFVAAVGAFWKMLHGA